MFQLIIESADEETLRDVKQRVIQILDGMERVTGHVGKKRSLNVMLNNVRIVRT